MKIHVLMGVVALLVAAKGPSAAAQEIADLKVHEVIYGHKDGLALTYDVFQPEKPNGAGILFMVSGGWYSRWSPPQQLRGLFLPFLNEGFTVYAVRHGSSPKYSIPEAVSDVRRAVRFIHLHAADDAVDSSRLGVMGMSAGGHLTLMLAMTGDEGQADAPDPVDQQASRIAAAVAFVPPTDLSPVVWEAPDSDPQYRNFPALNLPLKEAPSVSPVTHVTPDDAPSLVMMGAKDTLVPPQHGQWIHDKLDQAGVANKLIVYEGSGHGLEGNMDKAIQEAVTWFKEYLNQK